MGRIFNSGQWRLLVNTQAKSNIVHKEKDGWENELLPCWENDGDFAGASGGFFASKNPKTSSIQDPCDSYRFMHPKPFGVFFFGDFSGG